MTSVPQATGKGNGRMLPFRLSSMTATEKFGETERYLGEHTMSASEWHRVADNPVQRDTGKRAARATYLYTFSPIHCRVNMGVLPNGRRWKLDGHSRDYVWSHGMCDRPPHNVIVSVWEVPSMAALKALYDKFDSRIAVKNSMDDLYGAKRELKLTFDSPLLNNERFSKALTYTFELVYRRNEQSRKPDYKRVCMREFQRELLMLDDCQPNRERFPSAIFAAALVTLRLYPEEAAKFWDDYAHDRGIKAGNTMNGVEALWQALLVHRAKKQLTWQFMGELCGKAINCFERYRVGDVPAGTATRKKLVKNLRKYVGRAKRS